MITKPQIIKIKTLMGKRGLLAQSADLAYSFSDGATESVSGLKKGQALDLIKHLEKDNEPAPKERMQRKIISMAHELGWRLPTGKINMDRLNGWCQQYSYLHKPFNAYTAQELPQLVTAFEQVYGKHLKGI